MTEQRDRFLDDKEALQVAFRQYNKEREDAHPPEEALEKMCFSETLENRMGEILSVKGRIYYGALSTRRKRMRLLLVAVLLVSVALTCVVGAGWERFSDFKVETHKLGSELTFPKGPSPQEYPFVRKLPRYLPDGFEMTEDDSESSMTLISYTHSEGGNLTFLQLHQGIASPTVNTEGAEIQRYVLKNGREAMLYSNLGQHNIAFTDDRHVFILHLSDSYSVEELIKIAESIS